MNDMTDILKRQREMYLEWAKAIEDLLDDAQPPLPSKISRLDEIIHLLRNPHGHSEVELRQSRLDAAMLLDSLPGEQQDWVQRKKVLDAIPTYWDPNMRDAQGHVVYSFEGFVAMIRKRIEELP